jgi:hypothetical protein
MRLNTLSDRPLPVIPAKAGIQDAACLSGTSALDTGLRRYDDAGAGAWRQEQAQVWLTFMGNQVSLYGAVPFLQRRVAEVADHGKIVERHEALCLAALFDEELFASAAPSLQNIRI